MNHPQTAQQINASQLGSITVTNGQVSAQIPTEPTTCSRAPSGSWEFHVWKTGAKKGDKCLCGKLDYEQFHQMK